MGVVFVLSTLEFRFPDRGVILLFKKDDTGVEMPSLDEATGVWFSGAAPLRDNGVVAPGLATLGVKGVLAALALALSVGMSGGLVPLCLSYVGGIFVALPLLAVKGGCRIIAF